MAVVGGGGGNPRILIGQQCHVVQCHTVGLGVKSQGLRARLLLMAVLVFKCDVLKEGVGTLHYDGGTRIHGVSVVTTTETVVEHHGLVAVLAYDVEVGFRSGDVDMLVVLPVLHEDEPRFGAA